MKETMRHIDKIIIKHTSESRAASSCSSDIDRQELINNYGSEKYLSKWNLEGQDRNVTPDSNTKMSDQKEPGESQPSDKSQQKLTTNDDNESLASYNSVRDGTQSKSYLPYQIQPAKEEITLWQGYSGNIYFDPVKCRSLRINSSKPKRKPKAKTTGVFRLTKSCSPAVEVHTLNDAISLSAGSFHSLGSLRISSREEKKKKHTPRTQSQSGKLCKGFIDAKEKNLRRCQSTPESLIIAGGQVNGETDPIDSVFRHNTKSRLPSRSRDSYLSEYQSFPSLGRDDNWDKEIKNGDNGDCLYDKLPRVDQMSTVSKGGTTEPTPVFIIPFATLDDPVEPEYSVKQEKKDVIKTEKVTSKPKDDAKSTKDDTKIAKDELPKDDAKISKDHAKLPGKLIPKTKSTSVVKHNEKPKDCKVQITTGNSVVTHIVNITGEADNPRTSPRNTTESPIRREISNASLSNYLRAVPSQYSKTSRVQKQKQFIPKLSYTQRSRDVGPTDQFLDSTHLLHDRINGFSRTMALYGGYLPSTRPADTQNFHAEISSEASENDSVTSPPREERRHVTRGQPIKSCVKRPGVQSTEREQTSNQKCHLPVIGWHVS